MIKRAIIDGKKVRLYMDRRISFIVEVLDD